MLVKSWLWQALSERISYVLRACALDSFHSTVPHHVPQEMNAHINVARALSVSGILTHENAGGIVLPELGRPRLRACKPFEKSA